MYNLKRPNGAGFCLDEDDCTTRLGCYSKNHNLPELAGKIGDVHTQFVSNWERGMCAPPNRCFQKLIAALDVIEQLRKASEV